MTPKMRKRCTILGTFLILFPVGLFQTWANVAIYFLSFVLAATGSPTVGVQSPWVLTSVYTCKIVSLTLTGKLSALIGKRMTALFGFLLFNTGFIATYFTIGKSLFAFVATVSVISGSAIGVLEGVTLKYLIDWSDGDTGLMTSLVFMAYSIGAVFINQFVTLYTNPDNVTPDLTIDNFVFFSQIQILEKVPKLLLLFPAISFVMQAFGFTLLREHEGGNISENNSVESKELTRQYGACAINDCEETIGEVEEIEAVRPNKNNHFTSERNTDGIKLKILSNCEHEDKDNKQFSSSCQIICLNDIRTQIHRVTNDNEYKRLRERNVESQPLKNRDVATEGKDIIGAFEHRLPSATEPTTTPMTFLQQLSPILRSPTLYTMWLGYFFMDTINISVLNFPKIYGQLYIKDDYFFGCLATAMSVLYIISRTIGAFILDRIHYKTVMVGILSLSSILNFVMYFSAPVNKWFYLISTLSLGSVASIAVPTWITATVRTFGKENMNISVGLLMTSAILMYILSSPILEVLLTKDWYLVYLWASAMSAIGLFITVVFLKPQKTE